MASPFLTIVTAFGALAAVLTLVWLATKAARWGGLAPRVAGGRRLMVQDALALDARRRLTLVRCDGRTVLLLTGGAQDLVVGWMPEQWSSAADRPTRAEPRDGEPRDGEPRDGEPRDVEPRDVEPRE
jgi:flagellar protein FliO/FliZ